MYVVALQGEPLARETASKIDVIHSFWAPITLVQLIGLRHRRNSAIMLAPPILRVVGPGLAGRGRGGWAHALEVVVAGVAHLRGELRAELPHQLGHALAAQCGLTTGHQGSQSQLTGVSGRGGACVTRERVKTPLSWRRSRRSTRYATRVAKAAEAVNCPGDPCG